MSATAARRVLHPVLAGIVPVFLFAGCGSSASSGPTPPPTTVSSVVPAPVVDAVSHLTVHGAAGDVVQAFEAEGTSECVRRTAVIETPGGNIEVTVWTVSCGTNVPMNGRHGTYSSIDDEAVPSDAVPVTLAVGRAVTFSQLYTVYTNSATEYHEPVVLIALSPAVSAEYRMAMVVSPSGDLDAATVLAVATSLTIAN